MPDLPSVDAEVSQAQMDVELVIQEGIKNMEPERAARATLALDTAAMQRLIDKMTVEAFRAGYAARRTEEAREEAAREREFFDHARLITRISELPDRH